MTSSINEWWTAQFPDQLKINSRFSEKRKDGRLDHFYKADLIKNGFLIGEVVVSGYKYHKFKDGGLVVFGGNNFTNPHPWDSVIENKKLDSLKLCR